MLGALSVAGLSATVGDTTAKAGELPILIDALGTITPPQTATLVPHVSGTLEAVLFTEGQTVKKDQILARIDPRPYQQALLQAQGQRARDQAQLAMAQMTLRRYQRLLEQDSIARQDVDTQSALVKQLQGTVEANQAVEKAARINLDYCVITAPFSGLIGLRTVDPGNYVSVGTAGGIATLTQMQPIDVVFALPQDRIPDVQAAARAGNLPVTAFDRARARQLAVGHFLTLDNQVNVSTGTVRAKARFDNADNKLFPNQFVNVRLQLGTERGVLVPVTAVRTGPDGDYVYVIDQDNIAHMRPVKRGLSTDEQILIAQGLQAGERVVSEGGDRVKDGSTVRRADAAAPAGGASVAHGAAVGAAGHADKNNLSPQELEKLRSMSSEERRAYIAEKLHGMPPEEQRAYIEKLRALRAAREGAQPGTSGAAPAASDQGGATKSP